MHDARRAAWLIRDAPQQRLNPLIQRIVKLTGLKRPEAEVKALALLIFYYRNAVRTFNWEAIREIIIDRLEGSRRSIKGHEKEVIVRMALLTAFQTYFRQYQHYGAYSAVEMASGQVVIHNETYDISANLLDEQGRRVRRILIALKTRETEGGGHAHLFSRDILSAITTARSEHPDDYLIVVIVATNWSLREKDHIRTMVDHLVYFGISPGAFETFGANEQQQLNGFVAQILNQTLLPRQG